MIAMLAGLLACGTVGCSCAKTDSDDAASKAPAPGIELEGAHFTETRDGQKVWDLAARRVTYRKDAQVAELDGVSTRFFEDGHVVSVGEAPRATFHLDNRQLHLAGGIRVLAEHDQAGISAQSVSWLPDSGRLSAQGEVTFWRGPNRLSAPSLTADRALKRVELVEGVQGRLGLPPDGTLVFPPSSRGIKAP